MALRQTKKISELPALSPASLDTTFVVGISGSTTYKISINQLTSSLDTTFATDLVTATLSGSLDGKLSTSSFNSYTASISTASLVTSISNLNTFTASQSTSSLVNRLNAIESVSGSWITESETGSFLTSLSGAISSSAQITTFGFVSGSYETTGRGIISSSANLVTTSSFNSYTASISTASLVTSISNLNSATSSYLTSLSGAISSSSQITTLLPTGVVSGSAQTIANLPTGLISGSSQLTSSFDTRYVISGLDTMQISNSLAVTGSTTLKGTVNVGTGSGLEGGEIDLALAQSGNTTLTGSAVVFDVYGDKVRIFEGGGNSRGVSIDLSKAPNGVGGDLMWKASGLVNRGVDVTLGNLKARIAATGNVALQLSTVSGTYSVYGSSVYSLSGVAGTTIDGAAPKAISTTPAYLNLGYNFGTAGATDTWNIMDTSNSIAWRITMILGAGVNNNLVSIERLH